MMELKAVSFGYGEDGEGEQKDGITRHGIQNISLTIKKGEFVVLTGESGCGKTTLSRVLNGLCPQFYEGKLTGEYLLGGQNAQELSIDEIGQSVGSVFQDPRSQFFATNSTDEIVLAMENRTYTKELMDMRLRSVIKLLEMEPLLDRDMFHLSSGEKQKVAIASVCTVKPDILILDEPSANLDPVATQKLYAVLDVLKKEGYTIIVLEHRLYYLKELVDRMVVLQNGRLHKNFDRNEFQKLTNQEMEEFGLRQLNIKPYRKELVSASARSSAATSYVTIDHVQFQVKGKQILKDISLQLEKGEIIALTGCNGAGKSTTCKILSGLWKESRGTVSIGGNVVKPKKRIASCFFVQQDADYQLYAPTVYEEVTLSLTGEEYNKEEVMGLLGKMNLTEFVRRHPGSLSGGQKQRVLLAAAILKKRPVLILDEPTSGLDGKHMRQIARILREQAGQGTAILLITHDEEFIGLTADSVVRIQDGRTSEKQKVVRET